MQFTTDPAETWGVFSTLSCATSDTECDTDYKHHDWGPGQQVKVLPQYHIATILVKWQPDKDFIAAYPAQIVKCPLNRHTMVELC